MESFFFSFLVNFFADFIWFVQTGQKTTLLLGGGVVAALATAVILVSAGYWWKKIDPLSIFVLALAASTYLTLAIFTIAPVGHPLYGMMTVAFVAVMALGSGLLGAHLGGNLPFGAEE